MRKSKLFLYLLGFSSMVAPSMAVANESALVERMIAAYGGEEALTAVQTLQYEWVGYYIARHQSRTPEPPYNRLPIRHFVAVDFEQGKSAFDRISNYPGGLDLGRRTVINGGDSFWLNTISKISSRELMQNQASIERSASRAFPWLLVREILETEAAVTEGDPQTYLGNTYRVLNYSNIEILVHPETNLIHALQWNTMDFTEGEIQVRRVFSDYQDRDGIVVNGHYNDWRSDEATWDVDLYTYVTNEPIEEHLEMPEGVTPVPSAMGYNGQMGIEVEDLGDGIYIAGDGETRILYVEFNDHFVAMEAGGFPQYAENTYRAMEPFMKGKPLKYIIPTHHHDDHAIAVRFYAGIGATVLTTRDKEGYLRRLLARTWGSDGPVENAKFEYIEGPGKVLEDSTNRLDVLVYADAPHTENMLVGYVPSKETLFTADIFIGWAGNEVTQGASYGITHLYNWLRQKQYEGNMGQVSNFVTVHGKAYSRQEYRKMLRTERVIVTLPGNEPWPAVNWFEKYGLVDPTTVDPEIKKP